jgi:hypothetical protein
MSGPMSPRQLWVFQFGCWAAIATAAVHVAGSLAGFGPPANDTERQLQSLMTGYRFVLPGGASRTFMDLFGGMNLAFAVLLVAIGAVGLMVHRRARHDTTLMLGISRVLALTCVALLVISLARFFIVPTMFMALLTTCFALSSVEPPS